MRTKLLLLGAGILATLALATPQAQAQYVTGGYVGFGRPGFGGVVGVGGPVLSPAYAPGIVPYGGPAVVVPPPVVVTRPVYGPGWGYGPRYYRPYPYRYGGYGYGYGRRRW